MASAQETILTDPQINLSFDDGPWANRYPPILTVDQAAQLIEVSKRTIYDWSSRGRLKTCSRRVGKHLRIIRNEFLKLVFNLGINNDD